ncbi:MAG: energy transducer TonB [Bacteroidetes bacterium]|nr:energy transducer TonB [Bacteroidota bacterium]
MTLLTAGLAQSAFAQVDLRSSLSEPSIESQVIKNMLDSENFILTGDYETARKLWNDWWEKDEAATEMIFIVGIQLFKSQYKESNKTGISSIRAVDSLYLVYSKWQEYFPKRSETVSEMIWLDSMYYRKPISNALKARSLVLSNELLYNILKEHWLETHFIVVEDMPEFPGGDEKYVEFIQSNYKHTGECVEGSIYFNFIVLPDGGITNIKILKGVCKSCDEEAVRVIKSMPKWKPGYQRGRAVTVQVSGRIKVTDY